MLIFMKVSQIDTVNERYQADIFLQARWREPLLDATWNTARTRKNRKPHPANFNPATDLIPKCQLNSVSAQVFELNVIDRGK